MCTKKEKNPLFINHTNSDKNEQKLRGFLTRGILARWWQKKGVWKNDVIKRTATLRAKNLEFASSLEVWFFCFFFSSFSGPSLSLFLSLTLSFSAEVSFRFYRSRSSSPRSCYPDKNIATGRRETRKKTCHFFPHRRTSKSSKKIDSSATVFSSHAQEHSEDSLFHVTELFVRKFVISGKKLKTT